MRFVIQRDILLKALQLIVGIVERKQLSPILSNLHFDISDNRCRITGTDNEIQVVGTIEVEMMQQPGKTTFSAKKCFDICRSLPEQSSIEFIVEEQQRCILESDQSRFVLATLPSQDFPFIDDLAAHTELQLPQSKLKELLDRCALSMALEDIRTYLNGMVLEIEQDYITSASTDGHRLSLHRLAFDSGEMKLVRKLDQAQANTESVKSSIILPRKAVVELGNLLNDGAEPVTLGIAETHLMIDIGDIRFTSKLISGKYPNFQRIIPKTSDTFCVLEKEAFRQALMRTLILCNDKFRGAQFRLDKEVLTLVAQNTEQEEAKNMLAVDYNGEPIDVAFNIAYLLDVLNVVNDDWIRMSFTNNGVGGAVLEELNYNNSLFVIMAMQI